MLLDEIAAHLDDLKKDAFLTKINQLRTQAFLTTTNMFEFVKIKDFAQFFEIANNTTNEYQI